MNFLDRILSRTRGKDLPFLNEWIAEYQSRWSATTDCLFFWFPHVTKAQEALVTIFLSLFLPYWKTQEIFVRLANLGYQHRYDGSWEVVQTVLENEILAETSLDSDNVEKLMLGIMSEDDFFGNFLRECERFLKLNRYTFRDPERYRRPKRKIRRRGYLDKGTLRPYHQRGRNLPDPHPGIDRRSKVQHPLLITKNEWESSGESGTSRNRTLEKEVTY